MNPKDTAAVIGAFVVSVGLSMVVAYLLVRAYCQAVEVVYVMRASGPGEDAPAPADVNAMMNEVRRITREAGRE